VRDRVASVGGMNHFLLAAQSGSARDRYGESARYGAFAMEQLINRVLSRGTGRKANLEIKVFGGGKINAALDDVGAKNIDFVREFLANEGYELASEDVGGSYARRVLFKPRSGRAFVKRLDNAAGDTVMREELALVQRPRGSFARPTYKEIELF
jgi:chemotaxis protein CheD